MLACIYVPKFQRKLDRGSSHLVPNPRASFLLPAAWVPELVGPSADKVEVLSPDLQR